jgi:hypothetical protein
MSININVTKSSGEKVPFSVDKIERSLQRSGMNKQDAGSILGKLESQLYDGIPTQQIHKIMYNLLRRKHKPHAARYKLKQAIMELGPSGFPFEKYVAEILKHHGYEAELDQVLKGSCVNHEVDIVARKENKIFMVECKYHNQLGIICDVKIPLYIKARFDDIRDATGIKDVTIDQGWLVTNTRFSSDALQYGQCAGLHLTGWDYPENNGLKDQIDSKGLFPLTCLTTITDNEKKRLLSKKVVLCSEIISNRTLLVQLSMPPQKINKIVEEVQSILNS